VSSTAKPLENVTVLDSAQSALPRVMSCETSHKQPRLITLTAAAAFVAALALAPAASLAAQAPAAHAPEPAASQPAPAADHAPAAVLNRGQQIRADLVTARETSATAAAQLATQKIKQAITPDDQARLVDRYVTQMRKAHD